MAADTRVGRREFIKGVAGSAAAVAASRGQALASGAGEGSVRTEAATAETQGAGAGPRIRFGVVGVNHAHINGQVNAVLRGGGELVSMYAKEPDLVAAFAKQFPQARLVQSEREVLEDKTIQLVLSSIVPDERAPLGIRVMQHGKDYMADKPGITTLAQLAEVRRVQAETRRIYSIMYSERFENRATVKASELVKAGAIGRVVQTIGLGPHRTNVNDTAGVVFRQGEVRRHPVRHRIAPGRSVPPLHGLDARGRRRVAGRQRPPRAVSGLRGFRRCRPARRRGHRLHPRRLVHAWRPGDLGRWPADHSRH